jgi:hypothetical protein|tara:strand:- start:1741 stop:2097 length:357 start_codon:yes stop_codon:yes gene_type:complete
MINERKIKVMKYDKMQEALDNLKDVIIDKYKLLISDENMRVNFASNISFKKGKKFIKIIQGTSVWGFVALGDGLHKGVPYQRGDTFKPASWSAPAKWARGNVLNGDSHWYDWTGPNYL